MKNVNLRKRWLILPEFQIHFINRLTALFAMLIAVFVVHTMYYFNELRALGEQAQLPSDHVYYSFIESVGNKYIVSVSVAFSIAGVIFYLFGIYFSNKIAGPIYRLMKILDELKIEPDKQVSFSVRKGDYFEDLASKIEKALKEKETPRE
ncbi:MAG: hypothetical protein RJB66_369 [Pseudomonadota bacterium]|jgi:hypothetical protein